MIFLLSFLRHLSKIKKVSEIFAQNGSEYLHEFDSWYPGFENYMIQNYVKSFEQIDIKKNFIGEKGKMLSENLEVSVSFHNESPISIQLPNQISCKIDKTDIALKGQTVSSSYKPATLDNGIKIQVPPFIESGDEVVIDTRTIEYVKKI